MKHVVIQVLIIPKDNNYGNDFNTVGLTYLAVLTAVESIITDMEDLFNQKLFAREYLEIPESNGRYNNAVQIKFSAEQLSYLLSFLKSKKQDLVEDKMDLYYYFVDHYSSSNRLIIPQYIEAAITREDDAILTVTPSEGMINNSEVLRILAAQDILTVEEEDKIITLED